MKRLFFLLTTTVAFALFLVSVSPLGLKSAGLYWEPNAWDLTIYNSDTYLLPSRIFWVPLYLLPARTYDGLFQASLFTLPYWLISSALPSALISLAIHRVRPAKPEAMISDSTGRLPSEKSF